MLPNWQSKDKFSDRMILDEEPESMPPPLPPGMEVSDAEAELTVDRYKNDEEVKQYPVIPGLADGSTIQSKPEEKQPIADIPKTESTTSRRNDGNSDSNTKVATVYKAEVEKAPVSTKQSSSTTQSSKNTTSVQKVSKNVKKKSSSSKTKKKKSVARKTTTKSSIKSEPKSSSKQIAKGTTGTIEDRVKRLESKLNVHMQDTNSRLDSMERRIERLERSLPTP